MSLRIVWSIAMEPKIGKFAMAATLLDSTQVSRRHQRQPRQRQSAVWQCGSQFCVENHTRKFCVECGTPNGAAIQVA